MRNGYRVIDAHCHVYPEKIAAKAAAATDTFYEMEKEVCAGTTADLVELGTAAGIDRFIVQSVATTPKQVRSINTFIAQEVAASKGKLTGLGTLHPDSEDVAGDVEQILSLGLKGVKLHPDIQRFALDDPRCRKMYELCEGRLPMLLHTGDKRYGFSNPEQLLPVLRDFPELTVIGAHFGGWSVWEEASKRLAGIPNLWVDCSSTFYAVSDNDAILEMIHRYGTERVLFGTDYPMWAPEPELSRFFTLDLTDKERRLILSENAETLWGLENK